MKRNKMKRNLKNQKEQNKAKQHTKQIATIQKNIRLKKQKQHKTS